MLPEPSPSPSGCLSGRRGGDSSQGLSNWQSQQRPPATLPRPHSSLISWLHGHSLRLHGHPLKGRQGLPRACPRGGHESKHPDKPTADGHQGPQARQPRLGLSVHLSLCSALRCLPETPAPSTWRDWRLKERQALGEGQLQAAPGPGAAEKLQTRCSASAGARPHPHAFARAHTRTHMMQYRGSLLRG